MNTSNKFAVLQVQQPQQPRPKGDKLVTSISGPVSNVPKHSKDQDPSDKEKQNSNDRVNNNNNNRRGGERGRGRGGSSSRGGRGGNRGGLDRATQDKLRDPNAPPKRNKRIYDKNSNAPKNDSKKGGQGTGNWGNDKDEPRGADDAKKELVEGGERGEAEPEPQPEPVEEKTLTLKQYEEQRAALAPKVDAPKRREAGEGEKNNDLHKYTVLKKDEEENLSVKPKKEKAKKQNKKQTIAFSDFEVNHTSPSDRPRKYNNNNNNYHKKPKKVNIAIEDTDSYPALK